MIDKKILPVFGKMPINEITPKDIRKWQNRLTAYHDENGNPYAQTYLKTINNQLTAQNIQKQPDSYNPPDALGMFEKIYGKML